MGCSDTSSYGEQYIEASNGAGYTASENIRAFNQYEIMPHVLRGQSLENIDTTFKALNAEAPFGIAPMAFHKSCGDDINESVTAKAAETCGIPMIVPMMSTESIEDIRQSSPNATLLLQMHIFNELEENQTLITRAKKAGYAGIVITVDVPFIASKHNLRNKRHSSAVLHQPASFFGHKFSLAPKPNADWHDISKLIKFSGDFPVYLKGILHPEDAERAASAGAKGIIISNHGGRQLDRVPATIDCLPEIVKKLIGLNVDIYIDGGFRTASDIFIALALGAKAVFLGRPILKSLCHGGRENLEIYLTQLKIDLKHCMAQTGLLTLKDVAHSGKDNLQMSRRSKYYECRL